MPVLDCRIPKIDWAHEIDERNGVSTRKGTSAEESTAAGPWEPAVQRIVEFQTLGDDWDGLGAKAPSRELLASAVGLAYLLHERGVKPPVAVVPGVEGSVIFEWHEPDGTYAEVEVVRPLHAEVMVVMPGKPATHWTLPTD